MQLQFRNSAPDRRVFYYNMKYQDSIYENKEQEI